MKHWPFYISSSQYSKATPHKFPTGIQLRIFGYQSRGCSVHVSYSIRSFVVVFLFFASFSILLFLFFSLFAYVCMLYLFMYFYFSCLNPVYLIPSRVIPGTFSNEKQQKKLEQQQKQTPKIYIYIKKAHEKARADQKKYQANHEKKHEEKHQKSTRKSSRKSTRKKYQKSTRKGRIKKTENKKKKHNKV